MSPSFTPGTLTRAGVSLTRGGTAATAYLGVVIHAAEMRRVVAAGMHVPVLPHLLGAADPETGLAAG